MRQNGRILDFFSCVNWRSRGVDVNIKEWKKAQTQSFIYY